jgi:ATP-dependent Zn protease
MKNSSAFQINQYVRANVCNYGEHLMISPPTDSLYKFIAISGIVMLLWGAAFPWNKAHELKLQSVDLAGTIESVSQRSQQLQIKYDKLNSKLKALTSSAKDFVTKKEAIKAQKAMLYIQMLEDQLPANIDEKKLRVMVEAQNEYNNIGWASISVGFIFVFIGFWSWYFKIQRHLDRRMTSEEKFLHLTNKDK